MSEAQMHYDQGVNNVAMDALNNISSLSRPWKLAALSRVLSKFKNTISPTQDYKRVKKDISDVLVLISKKGQAKTPCCRR